MKKRKEKRMTGTFVAYDLETTGIRPTMDRILEIGAVRVENFQMKEEFQTFVNPGRAIPERIVSLTGITDDMVKDAKMPETAVLEFLKFCGDDIILGHNLIFDYSFIKVQAVSMGETFEKEGIDTLKIARKLCTDLKSRSLSCLCEHFEILNEHQHRAIDDAKATVQLYLKLCERAKECDEKLFLPSKMEYHVKKQSPITEKQLSYLSDLMKRHHLTPDVDLKSLRKSEASRMIDQILSTYGRW